MSGLRIQCFWMEPVAQATQYLRRYESFSQNSGTISTCPSGSGFHNASFKLENIDYPITSDSNDGCGNDNFSHSDPRWPKTCDSCSYEFREEDCWQYNIKRLFSGSPDGKFYSLDNAPPGAMYNATWFPNPKTYDGITLVVCLPPNGGNDCWMPDLPSTSGQPWNRTGKIPNVTCTPSILTRKYHGYLTGGWLIEC